LQAMTIRGPRKLPDAWAAAKIAPQSHWAWNASLWTYNSLRPHHAIKMLLELDIERGWLKKFSGYDPLLASAYHMIGKYREEEQTLKRHAKRFPAEPALPLWSARNAIARGDRKTAQEQMHLIPDQDLICEWSLLVDEYLIHGQKEEAQRLGARMTAKLAGMANAAAQSGCYVHSLYRLERNTELAAFLETDREQVVSPLDAAGMRGVLAARAGDKTGALKILRSLPDEMPSHFWRAQIASELGLKKEATDYLKIAYENGRRGVVEAHSPAHADREYFPRLRGYAPFEELVSQAN